MLSFRKRLHEKYGSQSFSNESCFLCGSASEITQEHVFPKWLQKAYDLRSQQMHLLNGTPIQYKQLKVPCCNECNTKYLSRLENNIREAVHAGYSRAKKLSPIDWYLWAGKIFYSILRKEFTLILDRKAPEKGTIINSDALKSFEMLHLFLQAVRGRHKFAGKPPYTVLICNLHDLGNDKSFGFRDDLSNFTFAMRMNEVGVIVSFEDAGLIQSSYGRYVEEVNGRKLHPIQFDELFAKVCYEVSRTEYTVKYITSAHIEGNTAVTRTYASGPLRPWDQQEFAECLLAHICPWLTDTSSIDGKYLPPNLLVTTWMTDEHSAPLILSKEEWEGNNSDVPESKHS